METVSGFIFAIKRFSLHDGPNLRTTVFFSGCPLTCHWCHNPEGMSSDLKVVSSIEKCVGCGECISSCPQQALTMGSQGIERNQQACQLCAECVRSCPALVHEQTGWSVTVADVMTEISKDQPFYDQSGGGVTFSGGEPFDQPAFLMALLRACKRRGIHRAIDTSVYTSSQTLLEAAQLTDLILCDIKHMDPDQHKRFTGVDNKLILENIRLLDEAPCKIRIRLPLIPGVNDSSDNIAATVAFIKQLDTIEAVDVLPYHQAAKAKYDKMGSRYPGEYLSTLEDKSLEQTVALLDRNGITAVVGG